MGEPLLAQGNPKNAMRSSPGCLLAVLTLSGPPRFLRAAKTQADRAVAPAKVTTKLPSSYTAEQPPSGSGEFFPMMCLASHERCPGANERTRARAAARLGFPERQVRVARLGSLADPPAARSARSGRARVLLARAARSARSESQACSLGSLGARCPSLVPERQLGSLERRFGACSFAQLERAELLLLRADFRSRALERKNRSDSSSAREPHHW